MYAFACIYVLLLCATPCTPLLVSSHCFRCALCVFGLWRCESEGRLKHERAGWDTSQGPGSSIVFERARLRITFSMCVSRVCEHMCLTLLCACRSLSLVLGSIFLFVRRRCIRRPLRATASISVFPNPLKNRTQIEKEICKKHHASCVSSSVTVRVSVCLCNKQRTRKNENGKNHQATKKPHANPHSHNPHPCTGHCHGPFFQG
jgi:hypothetical protein